MKSSSIKNKKDLKARSVSAKPDAVAKNVGQKRVLLVEDDPLISRAYAIFIARSGFAVDVALNVLEARKRITAHHPDLVLLDVIMPGINGFEFLEELKKKNNTRDVPVIMISNLCENSAIMKCKRLGAVDYLIKSNFFLQEVVEKIGKYIATSAA